MKSSEKKYLSYILKSFLAFIFFISIHHTSFGQDLNARSPKPVAGSHQQQVADKKKKKQQQENDKAVKKAQEKHMKLQAKNTKKMMKKSKRSANRWNNR